MHHAFFIEAEPAEGVRIAKEYIEENLGLDIQANPDVVVLEYGLFSVEDARRVAEVANSAALRGEQKAIIIAASRAYHEAQNSLLKIFEEPAPGTHLFLILPSAGQLLPTLRSRVQMLRRDEKKAAIPEAAKEFLAANREKRTTIAKKLASASDEEERRENRDEALAIVNGVEAVEYANLKREGKTHALLSDISALRSYLYERSAPIRMILEHLALIIPKELK